MEEDLDRPLWLPGEPHPHPLAPQTRKTLFIYGPDLPRRLVLKEEIQTMQKDLHRIARKYDIPLPWLCRFGTLDIAQAWEPVGA
jgi:hypothetical protein